ncbi:acetylxylan esterase, partial [candidate division KSB1 bacterium]
MKRTQPFFLAMLALCLCCFPLSCGGQADDTNYDESKVPAYTLPDPLVSNDGTKVTDAQEWRKTRRPEILELFKSQVYGVAPGQPKEVSYSTIDSSQALNGLATRKQVSVTLRQDGRELNVALLLYVPNNQTGPAPAFLGLNFGGNHTIRDDPGIVLNPNWMRQRPNSGIVNNRATEESRGSAASRWDVEKILGRGYALATVYYGDIDPDYDDGFQNGVHELFDDPGGSKRAADGWGSIGGWAWGLSRIMDYLEWDGQIDHDKVVVLGHSRLGKTALWAGARDERFAMVISNNSGCGGAALSRRRFGETVEVINTSFPHWFCRNFRRYNGKEDELPVDQHMLLALMAPRPVYVASAEEDRWADPKGEFLSLKHASPVYRLLTGDGLSGEMPPVDQPIIGRQSYHVRSGRHNVTGFDW